MAASIALSVFVTVYSLTLILLTESYQSLPICDDENRTTKYGSSEDCRRLVRYHFEEGPELVSVREWKYNEETTCQFCAPSCNNTRYFDTISEDTDCKEHFERLGFYRTKNVWVKETTKSLIYVAKLNYITLQKKVYLPLPSEKKCYFVMRNDKFKGKYCSSKRFVRDVFNGFPSRCPPGKTYHRDFQECVNNTRNNNYRFNE